MSETLEVKICLLGDSGVGKSSLATRFVQNVFNSHNESTIGASFLTKTFIQNDVIFKLNIWDTAGQEMYRALAPMYYRKASVCVVVYDVTQQDSFASIQSWVRELQTHAHNNLVIALAANKSDLEEKRKVTSRDGREMAERVGALFWETSAKSAQNVNQLFESCALLVPRSTTTTTGGATFPKETQKSKCC